MAVFNQDVVKWDAPRT